MAKRAKASQLGVEIGANEIRVVETLSSGHAPVLVAVGSAPCPPGSFINGRIHHIDALAVALKRLLDSMGTKATKAIFAVPSAECICRQFNMPPTPDDELRVLVEGEVRHYQVLQTAGGVFDFFRLKVPDPKSNENPIVLVGAEEDTTENLRELADRSGLEVAGIEPTWVGAVRGAFPLYAEEQMAMTISVLEASVEIVATVDGSPILYRHLEIGMNSLLAEQFESREGTIADNVAVVTESMPNGEEVRLLKGPLDSLVVELRRSADFIAREFSAYGRVTKVFITGNHPKLPAILEPIRATLEVPTTIVVPTGFTSASESVTKRVNSVEGHTFLGAFGLSLHGGASVDPRAPTLDLASHVRTLVVQEGERRILTSALVASIAVVAFGGIGFYFLQRDIGTLDSQIKSGKGQLAQMQAASSRNLKLESLKTQAISSHAANNIDLVAILDIVTSSISDEIGIKQISIRKDTGVRVVGEASSESAIVATVEAIQKNADIKNVSIESFEFVENESGNGVRFQIVVTPVGYSSSVVAAN